MHKNYEKLKFQLSILKKCEDVHTFLFKSEIENKKNDSIFFPWTEFFLSQAIQCIAMNTMSVNINLQINAAIKPLQCACYSVLLLSFQPSIV